METPPYATDLAQIAVTVSDVAKAKHFYCGILGLPLLFDAGPNLSFFRAGTVRVMLTTPQGAGSVGHNSILYFRVASLDMAFRSFVDRGATAERAPQLTARMSDHELWIAFLRDPDGNIVGLMEERR